MKAERRHQLQTNSLAHALEIAPHFLRRYGSQILLGIAIAILAVVLIRRRAENARQAEVVATEALTTARSYVDQVQTSMLTVNPEKPENLIGVVRNVRELAEKYLDVAAESDDPKLIAEARIARGDLNWQLAGLPDIPGAATQPSLKLEKSDAEFLDTAAKAYQEVVNDSSSPELSRITARLSLASIAENRRKWDEAKTQYAAVIDDASAGDPFKAQARERLKQLDDLKVEPFVGKPPIASPVEGPSFPGQLNLTPTLPGLTLPPTSPSLPESSFSPFAPTAPTTPGPAAPAPAEPAPTPTEPAKPSPDAGTPPVEKK